MKPVVEIRFRLAFLFCLLLRPIAEVRAGETPKPVARPNILLIYSDDHGWADLGLQGVDKDIRTPHLDQLGQEGVRFTRGYVTAPQCVPSRAGVITGRYQQRFGVEDNNKGPLPLSELTIAERLKPAGYTSGWVGKSHLDINSQRGVDKNSRILLDHLPHHQGFDEYFRGEMRDYYASHSLDGKPIADAPKLVHDTRFRVEVQTEAALSFLDRRSANPAQPWFLYLAWYAPHVPLESPEPWFSKTPVTLPKERRQALAMIAAMDDAGPVILNAGIVETEINGVIRFLLPAHRNTLQKDPRGSRDHFILSSSSLLEWKLEAFIPQPTDSRVFLHEGNIAIGDGPGELKIVMRTADYDDDSKTTNPPRAYSSISADGGHTWSEARPEPDLHNTKSKGYFGRASNGTHIYVYNDGPAQRDKTPDFPNGGRTSLRYKIKPTGGAWCEERTFYDAGVKNSYPTLVEVTPSDFRCVWDSGTADRPRTQIKFDKLRITP